MENALLLFSAFVLFVAGEVAVLFGTTPRLSRFLGVLFMGAAFVIAFMVALTNIPVLEG